MQHVLDEVDGALPKLLSDFQNFAASSSTPFAERKSASLRSDISSDDEAQVLYCNLLYHFVAYVSWPAYHCPLRLYVCANFAEETSGIAGATFVTF